MTGTTTALLTVRSSSRRLTNWFGNSAPSALVKRALAFTVPVCVSTMLSSVEKLPSASRRVRVRSKAVVASVAPWPSRSCTSGTRSCGMANSTSMGAICVMVATPPVLPVEM
ncbi:hypothetical protein D3C71_997620 [compost metagenome]